MNGPIVRTFFIDHWYIIIRVISVGWSVVRPICLMFIIYYLLIYFIQFQLLFNFTNFEILCKQTNSNQFQLKTECKFGIWFQTINNNKRIEWMGNSWKQQLQPAKVYDKRNKQQNNWKKRWRQYHWYWRIRCMVYVWYVRMVQYEIIKFAFISHRYFPFNFFSLLNLDLYILHHPQNSKETFHRNDYDTIK